MVVGWAQILKGEVFEVLLDPADAEAVGEGRVDVERLLRDALLLLRDHVLQSAHVVRAVGQLDENHANVARHGDDHLAEVFGLLLFLGDVGGQLGELGDAVDELGHLGAEQVGDVIHCRQRVFDRVVQQAGDDRRLVELELRQDAGHLERVDEVGLARLAHLPLMDLGAVDVSLLDDVEVGVGIVLLDPVENVVEPEHGAPRALKGSECGPLCLGPRGLSRQKKRAPYGARLALSNFSMACGGIGGKCGQM